MPAVTGASPGIVLRIPALKAMEYPSSQLYASSPPPAGRRRSVRSIDTAAVTVTSNGPTGPLAAIPAVERSGMSTFVIGGAGVMITSGGGRQFDENRA